VPSAPAPTDKLVPVGTETELLTLELFEDATEVLELERLEEAIELDREETTELELDMDEEVFTEQVPSEVNKPFPKPAVVLMICGTQSAESSL
jgi:hypothetical protein